MRFFCLFPPALRLLLLVLCVSSSLRAELTLRNSNGTSGSVYSPMVTNTESVEFKDDSLESLRGQSFVARYPDSEDAGWLLSRITLRVDGSKERPTLGSVDVWTVTIIEWESTFDGNDVAAWLAGTAADALAGFEEPTVVMSDSGSFAADTTLSSAFFIFDVDPAGYYFLEAGKAYAVYFVNQNGSGESFWAQTGQSERSEVGVMLYQENGFSPSVFHETDLSVWVHGVAHTPDDGRELAPQFTMGSDITLPMNWEPYSEVQVTNFLSFNDGQSLVWYTVANDNAALFSQQPSIDNEGVLSFAPAPDAFGVATVTVYVTDDGASNNRSAPLTFTITIRDREALAWRVDANSPASPETQDGLSWKTAFASLQDALALAFDHDEIWVAAGVYYPDEALASVATVADDDRDATFQLIDGVDIYGGFAGDESERSQRDPKSNRTILSGDIDHETNPDSTVGGLVVEDPVSSISGGNAVCVVAGTAAGDVLLDGVTITAGDSDSFSRAGGYSGSGELRNCVIQGNKGRSVGGIFSIGPKLSLVKCDLISNRGEMTGGLEVHMAELEIVSCRIQGNEAGYNEYGVTTGGISVGGCNGRISGTLFAGNKGSTTGAISLGSGQGSNEDIAIDSCTIAGNLASGDNVTYLAENGGLSSPYFESFELRNTVIWGNWPVVVDPVESGIRNANTSSSLVEGMDLGGSNLNGTLASNDPLFIWPLDAAEAPTRNGSYSLEIESPLVGYGDGSLLSQDFADLDGDEDTNELLPLDVVGNLRIVQALDIGAFERGTATDPFASLADFRSYYGLAADGSNDAEDWSGFGVKNVLYYAFGAADKIGAYPWNEYEETNAAGMPWIAPGDGSLVRIGFNRSRAAVNDLVFSLQRSEDLEDWQPVGDSAASPLVTPLDDRVETVVEELAVVSTAKAFFRIAVTPKQ